MIRLTPFLLFDGNCAEAMAFYQSCLNGELSITKVANTPMKNQMPPEKHHKVAHAHLKSDAIEFSGEHEQLCEDRKSTRLNSSHVEISYAVFCLKKKKPTMMPGGDSGAPPP